MCSGTRNKAAENPKRIDKSRLMEITIVQTTFGDLGPAEKEELLDLIDAVQFNAPYYYPPEKTSRTWGKYLDPQRLLLAKSPDQQKLLGYLGSTVFSVAPGPELTEEKRKFVTDETPDDWVYLSELGVAAETRGQGVGIKLMKRFHADVLPPQTKVLLRTPVHDAKTKVPNPAITFYQKLGYKILHNDGEPFIIMHNNIPRHFLQYRP